MKWNTKKKNRLKERERKTKKAWEKEIEKERMKGKERKLAARVNKINGERYKERVSEVKMKISERKIQL